MTEFSDTEGDGNAADVERALAILERVAIILERRRCECACTDDAGTPL